MNKKSFNFHHVDMYYHQFYENGEWKEPIMSENPYINIEMSSPALHYGQQAFEGMKAYRTKKGNINLFRPFMNANRFRKSCKFMMMPQISDEHFISAIKKTIIANQNHVPEYDYKQALYVRPFMVGIGHNIGLKSANKFYFGVFVVPVGEYLKSDKAHPYLISEQDRVAPIGTGPFKIGGNYGAVMKVQHDAKEQGYQDVVFLDPKTHTKIDEGAGSNIFGVKGNKYITPESKSILKSITNDSLKVLAKDLGLEVKTNDIYIKDIETFDEMGACGTAAIVSPIGSMTFRNETYHISHDVGPITKQLRERLLGIQFGDIKDIHNWIEKVV